ncbi:MAG: type I-C CRISPR-associated protein Cas8c/Csd1 [Legionellales bacterium]|nr:type I-C CRISPR-associated protein Cas8c/Csd1 [Legionellales bacterium]
MILQALKDYYDRKIRDPESEIAPKGFEHKEIPFVIVIDAQGQLVQIEDTRYKVGSQSRAKAFLVPQSVKRTAGIKANLLWDNAKYLLGLSVETNEQVVKCHQAFINRIIEFNINDDEAICAILNFLKNDPIEKIKLVENFSEIEETNPFMAIRLSGDLDLVCQKKMIIDKIIQAPSDKDLGICLITGDIAPIANLHPSIKGVKDAKSTGGNIISFNQKSFLSFAKEQGSNAPIGDSATFAYTTALNHLLRKDSNQKIQIGDATTVFWSQKKSAFENEFSSLFEESPNKDDPDRFTENVKSFLNGVDSGVLPESDKENSFYILGLSPNQARISIRFWHVGTIEECSLKIAQHFHDMEIIFSSNQKPYYSIWRYLIAIAAQGKSDNIPPNIAGNWMRCILAGLPYPEALFQAVLRRITAEQDVTQQRAAIIKAYLNRRARFQHQTQQKEITVSLDPSNHNIGYCLGRIFSVLEKIQEEANPGINATIRDKYYSAVSGTPAHVMPILMRLKNHHINKLASPGRKIYFEKLLGQIMENLHEFPKQLNLPDQGRFAIGYYHQRQAFFTKKENVTEGE